MKNKRKTLWGLLITLGLLLGLLPVGAVATPVDSYDIWIEGEQVTSLNAADVLGDSTVSYDVDTKTLTLNNANLENKEVPGASGSGFTFSSAVLAKKELSIKLQGTNTITLKNNSQDLTFGIFFRKKANIIGNGSLKVQGEVDQTNVSGVRCTGLNFFTIGEAAKLDIDLKSSKEHATGVFGWWNVVISDQAVVKARIQGPASYGIVALSPGLLTVKDQAKVDAVAQGSDSFGIYTFAKIKDDAQVIAAGDEKGFSIKPDLSEHNNTPVEVSGMSDGSNAAPWDGTTDLGGSYSPYSYVKIAPTTDYDVWVEGKRVTSANAANVLGDGTVSYDAKNQILTLNNASLENKDVPKAVTDDISWYTQSSAIFAKEDLTIHLKGNNSIALSGNTQAYTHGISFVKNGKVLGDGSLNIKGEVNQAALSGIFASKSLTIGDSAKLDIDLKSSKIILKGVYGRDEMVIGDQAVVKARGQGPDSYGIGSYDDDNITIKDDAQVTAAGDQNALYRTFDLSDHNNTYVEVSTKADGSDATPWDGTTALGGSDSPYKYVKIEKGLYAITFDENYSDAPTPAVLATDGSGKLTAFPTNPERSGYQFINWNTAQDGSGTEVTAPHTFSADTTLYAQWKKDEIDKINVTFNENYSGAPDSTVLTADENGKLTTWPKNPVRANHVFLGWNTKADGTGDVITSDDSFTGDTILYAQWRSDMDTVAVTFDWNGAEAATITLSADETGKVSTYPEVPNYGDYRFSGWNTARDGSGTAITKDHVFSADTTLYAQWQKSERGGNKTYGDYSGNGTGPLVNFDPNYADAPAAESKRADKNGKFAQLPAPKREGHLFLGWFKDKDGSGTALTADHVFTNGETVYAKWADGKDALRVIMTIGSHDYLVNDVAKTMDTVPFIEKDRTFVPIRALAEAFGAEVIWDGNERSVTIKDGDKTVLMTIGDKSYRVNDESKEMDVAPFINKDNRTMIPVRFATEALGYQVDYQQKDEVAKVIFTRG